MMEDRDEGGGQATVRAKSSATIKVQNCLKWMNLEKAI